MPRGTHPNSRKNLVKGKPFDAETARKAKEKSDAAKITKKSLTEDLRDRCTPERIAKMNERIISMAEHGNLHAYELVRDGLGEKPKEKVEHGGTVGITAPPKVDFSNLSDEELNQLDELAERMARSAP